MKPKTKVGIGIVAMVLIAWPILSVSRNPLRRDSDIIRQNLLAEKPLGTPMTEIERWLKEDKKVLISTSKAGYLTQNPGEAPREVGVSSIHAAIGTYTGVSYFFAPTVVGAYWGFDQRGLLIDVYVLKGRDAI